jgi:hypothetical protein
MIQEIASEGKKVGPTDIPSARGPQRVTDPASTVGGRGCLDTKALSVPRDRCLPLEDPATLAAGDAPMAFVIN